ncbi:prolipoprotein diacylglyceryl transferase [Caproiciproducens faecalis]|uniref:Phosphatidylglycerol--prolipoprotein diacylglyceryl transferase n=1 Tax=Caproiciproducens faecalis TaxID=2820301 RepID=A0ABS7DR19_9FIRM|nr:prolipoprotein diacylglyceryl transferase [Caproiciproducens faecalis]MBW7573746.1 prolipoprotein diacylglyceryl transferase [Caproiciproducens faecalis]
MLNVQFPGLGIHFTINPIAFSIGSLTVRWYGVIIAVGFLLAFLYVMSSCKKFNMDQDKLIDAVIVGIIGGIIGARAYYVIFDTSDQYLRNPISALYIWEGGLGIYGGIIGGLLCGALIAKLRKISIPAMLDLASLGFLIGQTIGRWGNFVNQEAFGRETTLPWGMVSENTSAIANGPVHPCFLYESLWCLLGFVLLHIFSRKFRRYDGQVFLGYLIWYGVGRFFIEGLRTDSLITPILPLRVSQVVAVATVLTGVALMVVFRNRTTLAGCGSPKVMALNAVVDEVPEELIDDGTSTIFDQSAAEDTTENTVQEPVETEPAAEEKEISDRASSEDAVSKDTEE